MDKVVFAMSFFQIAMQAVVAVEQVIGRGKGDGKRKIVIDAVQAVAKVAGEDGHPQVAAIGTLVDSIVGSLNQSGILEGWPQKGEVKRSEA